MHVAAALGTFFLYAPIDTRWESFLAGLLLLLAFLSMDQSCRQQDRASLLLAAAIWGALLLTNPVTILLLVAWPMCWIVSRPRRDRARYTIRFALISGIALLLISPWVARDYSRFGAFLFVRDNLGLELSTSNNPCAAPSIRENIQSGCHVRTHPNSNAAIAAQVAAAGELQFNRAKFREALSWIASHRAAFLKLTVRRFRLFWFPEVDRAWEGMAAWIVTLLSLVGLWRMAGENRAAAALLLAAWLLFPLVYYVIQFDARYRYPIYWTSLLPAGYALTEILRRMPIFRSAPPAQP